VEPAVAFALHSESKDALAASKSTKKPDYLVQCIVAPLKESSKHACFAKSFLAKLTMKKV